MTARTVPADRPQTRGEEIANAISHGLGALLAVAALPILVTRAMGHGEVADVVAAAIFASTGILLYGISTLYHALPASLANGRVKAWLMRLDHAAIYVFIAGSYTPFTLGVLQTGPGVTLLVAVWAAAAFGVTIKLLNRLRHPLVSTALYLAMGWVVVFAITRVLPADAAVTLLGENATPAALAAVRERLHLNDPAWLQYWHWLSCPRFPPGRPGRQEPGGGRGSTLRRKRRKTVARGRRGESSASSNGLRCSRLP